MGSEGTAVQPAILRSRLSSPVCAGTPRGGESQICALLELFPWKECTEPLESLRSRPEGT